MRIVRDILIGIVTGLLAVGIVTQAVPKMKPVLDHSLGNMQEDMQDWVNRGKDFVSQTDFTSLFVNGEVVSDEEVFTDDSGITGDGYAFDSMMHAYYGLLDEDEQALYRQMYANVESLSDCFVPEVNVNADQVNRVFEAMFYDCPELFWLGEGYSYKYYESGEIVEILLQYNELANDLETHRNAFWNVVNTIVSEAQKEPTVEQQERYVHDRLVNMITYDIEAPFNQSAYSALVNQNTVCAGYAKSFQLILQQLGIPTYYVVGESESQEHAWNIVYVNGQYRNVDLTWDDTSGDTYRYFNVSDAILQLNHTRTGLSIDLPACH